MILNEFPNMNNIKIVEQIAQDYKEWANWNKTSAKIEVFENNDSITVIHNLYDSNPEGTICNSWEFLNDIKYILKEYSNESKEDLEYVKMFWNNKRYND